MIGFRKSTSVYVPKTIKSRDLNRITYTHVHGCIFPTAKSWKQPERLSPDQWCMDTPWIPYGENIMLRYQPVTKRTNNIWCHLEEAPSLIIFRQRKQSGGSQRPGKGLRGSYCLMGTEFQFGRWKELPRWMVEGCTTMCMCLIPQKCT